MVGKRSVHWLQIRSYIFARHKIGQSAKTIFSEICNVYGHNEASYSILTRWISKFKAGKEQFEDLKRTGSPKTVRELARLSGISPARVHFVLRKVLLVNKKCAR